MNWYYMDGDKQVGPVSHEVMISLIRSGALSRKTPVWKEGLEKWLEAEQTELVTSFTAQEEVTPPPYRKTNVQTVQEQLPAVQPRKKRHPFLRGCIGLVILVIGLAWRFHDPFASAGLAAVGFWIMMGWCGTENW